MTDLQSLRSELDALAAGMKPTHLAMAKALVDGRTQEEAYIASGLRGKDARQLGYQLIITNPHITEYVELAKKIAYEASVPEQIGTLEQKRQMLWDMALTAKNAMLCPGDDDKDAFNHNAVKAAQACIAELNKMDGHNKLDVGLTATLSIADAIRSRRNKS